MTHESETYPENGEPLFRRTKFVRELSGRYRMCKSGTSVPFGHLQDDDMLTTADVLLYLKCGLRTLRRWISKDGLRPDGFYKQQLLFYKRTVLRWERSQKPKRGRPRTAAAARVRIDPVEALRRRLLAPRRTPA
jgi:hypothetical protein